MRSDSEDKINHYLLVVAMEVEVRTECERHVDLQQLMMADLLCIGKAAQSRDILLA